MKEARPHVIFVTLLNFGMLPNELVGEIMLEMLLKIRHRFDTFSVYRIVDGEMISSTKLL